MAAELAPLYFDDGSRFFPTERQHPGGSPFCDFDAATGNPTEWDDQQIITFASGLWQQMYEAKRAEIERLKQNSLYVDGFHYTDPMTLRQNAVTNRIYQLVEAQVATATSEAPRPEIVMRGGGPDDLAERLEYFAEFLEDTNDYDNAIVLGARDKFIYGYNVWLISFDYATGMPFVKNLSVFHWYWDPAGRNEEEIAHCAIGMPVSTHRLREQFPGCDIKPDKIASPEYGVNEEPWSGFLEQQTSRTDFVMPNMALNMRQEGTPATQAVSLSVSTGYSREWGTTTYLIQLMVCDAGMVDVLYKGTLVGPDGTIVDDQECYVQEPRTESGWWLINLTGTGTLLGRPQPLDPCFLGLPVVVDRNQQRTDRYVSTSEVDQAIPIQRGLNRRKILLMRGLELSANPPLVATQGAGINSDKGTVAGGEILTIARGSDLKYLEFRGPSPQQFEMLSMDASDMESVVGVPDVQRGIKPSGIEAASAIARLDDNSLRRMAGKENPAHRARSLLLRKLMYCAGKKLQQNIMFMASNGSTVTVTANELLSQYHVRFARKSGTPEGRQQLEDKALILADKGYIDQQNLLKIFNWRDRDRIVARTAAQKTAELLALAQGQANAGGGEGSSSTPAAAAA